MGRTRSLKPSFFTNDELGQLDPLARLLFAGLWTMADRDGRLLDRPPKIKAEILPFDAADVDVLLAALAEHGFIRRYRVRGHACIAIVTWAKHQSPHRREVASEIPPPASARKPVLGRAEAGPEPVPGRPLTTSTSRNPEPGTGYPEPGPQPPEAATADEAVEEDAGKSEEFSREDRERIDAAMAVLARFGFQPPPRFWRQILDAYPGKDLEASAVDIADWLQRSRDKTCSTSLVRKWLARGAEAAAGGANGTTPISELETVAAWKA